MGHIILGLFIVVAGALVVIKSNWIYQNVGAIQWAETHLGPNGGSRLLYQLIGILTCIIGFMVMTNLWQGLVWSIFGNLFSGLKSK